MQEFFTWAVLASYAGATLATALITELLKGVPPLSKLHTRIVSYAVAALLLLAGNLFTTGLDLQSAALALINAAVVSLASNGAFEITKKSA